ncbi:MAG TPA: hypothetical protein VIL27_01370 [Clostridia bacterium]
MALKFDRNRRRGEESTGEQLRDLTEDTGRGLGLGRIVEAVNRSYGERAAAVEDKADKVRADALREQLSHIHVAAFIGSSGTGKSTRAISVSRQYSIDHIIDDGLLINGSRIVAGSSAKKANSKIESVRQALFADPTRAAVMRRALAAQSPVNLMVLGTSEGMLTRICDNLWLPQPSIIIRIEDVSTEDEMRQAKETRVSEGMHTIPVPSMEIKHEFSGVFSDPFNRLRRRRDRERGMPTAALDSERTVVRPTFSSLGSYSLSDGALRNMIEIILRNTQGVYSLLNFNVVKEVYGIVLYLEISLYYGFNAQEVLARAQERISARIEEYTSINVIEVNIKARRVVHSQPATARIEPGSEAEAAQTRAESAFGAPDAAPGPDDTPPPEVPTADHTRDAYYAIGPSGAIISRLQRAAGFIRGFFLRK